MTAVVERTTLEILTEDHQRYLALADPCPRSTELSGGSSISDYERRSVLDFTAGGAGIMVMGHQLLRVRAMMSEQLNHYGQVGDVRGNVARMPVEYARALVESFDRPEDDLQVHYTPDEDAAFSAALVLAQDATGRAGLAMYGDEGTDWSASAALVTPLVSPPRRPLGTLVHPTDLGELSAQARASGALVVIDETRTGFGRTGALWGQQRWGVPADITVVGAAAGGGFPFGAVIAPRSLFDRSRGLVASETAGNPVVCAAGLATLTEVQEAFEGGLMGRVAESGRVLHDSLQEIRATQFSDVITDVYGVGLMQYLALRDDQAALDVARGCLRYGLLVPPPQGSVIALTPPLVIEEDDIRRAVDMISGACIDLGEQV